ncbi:hypothetical protein BS50DRAFT_519189 [Corynespora cassiicola Philippines]|uniref:Dipeptidyl-peptidase V n=1 Tax=Corynespora cassiicola Philippines TaxID=1448308 RepID=A0A2T2NWH2_CORCC|nr:hypothetical protein BS50DRAFT_519189 [Corynespora cassiicola Philippines]
MTIRAAKFTPEVLLSAPRRSAGVPNADGSQVLYSISTYSFGEHRKKSEIRLLDVESQESSVIVSDGSFSAPTWIDDKTILLLHSESDGTTTVKVGPVKNFKDAYSAGIISGPVGDLKTHRVNDSTVAIAVSGSATSDGNLHNPEKAKKPLTTGRLYTSLFVRHWDHYVTENKNAIFIGTLTLKDDKYKLSELKNALKGTKLSSPIEPFGGADHFDISSTGLVFTSKDPDLNPALHTKTNIYLSVASDFWDLSNDPQIQKVELDGIEGASTSPVFSPDGSQLAFLSMKTDGYESDKNQIFIVPDVRTPSWVIYAFASKDGKGTWDRSPQSINWSPNGKTLYFTAEEHGRVSLFVSHFTGSGEMPNLTGPWQLVKGGTITSVSVLEDGGIFLSSTSLIENSLYSRVPALAADEASQRTYMLPTEEPTANHSSGELTTQYISSSSRSSSMFGLSRRQVGEIHWPGAAPNTSIHAWVVKPSTFDSSKKYPLAYLIHGGPQGAWEDGWSTRWNPAVFAEQGYVVIAPNPTGSTGYGQDFTDAIQGQWGGLPYEDLVMGFDWIKNNLGYVDTERAVALGASYGGYMMNWIQGHPLGRHFKALVTHDGVFSMTGQLASEELYFPFHDLRGPQWEHPDRWSQWDPSRFTRHWATPHLIIHSELDYRLTISEGLSAFNVLQARGVPSQFLTFPDENHWVLNPENSLLWHRTVLDWINGYVGLERYSAYEERVRREA